ncbi:helix-turn-helix domain-containing protein [Paenibacillus allorhizosphaerae]|uniref:HTH-type transcriptional activator Btr n=1 Tax=Paenibacillus allorhizosphaerae TaxID=2849866 RepID=A0ABM8VFB1_9BACL|nr:AraC family transcriptional regulator [Paenibacillus allorhizosphaerae]CAG7634155.1 HTH-type transcriptional activator Btr [Paenibacillus allorhizosphaerae]
MQHAFFDRIHLRIIDVLQRDRTYSGSVGHVIRSPSTHIRSFLYAYEGKGMMELGGVSYPLSAGCVFHFPMNQSLLIDSSPEQPLCYFTVRMDYKFIEWEGMQIRSVEPDDRVLPFDYVVPMPDKETMLGEMQRLHSLWHSKQPGYEWGTKLAFMNILQRVSEKQQLQEEHNLMAQSILKCKDYIRNHYHEPLERETLARKASLSTSYFSVMFKKHTGYSPVQYITKIRLDKAKLLLRQKHLTIADVAREVGFRDPLYFAKVFSHEIGVPPREYRNM